MRGSKREITTEAYVIRRTDFGETSRIVTLFTRDLGRVACLARGAHRGKSPFLGTVDLLLRINARIIPRGGQLQLLGAARVVHGNSAFLNPASRLAEATALTELFSWTLPEGRPDRALFDLYKGGLMLIEKVPSERLDLVRVGLQVKLLLVLGLLADPSQCGTCGRALSAAVVGDGFHCAEHGPPHGRRISGAERELIAALAAARGRDLPGLKVAPSTLARAARTVRHLVAWLLERPRRGQRGRRPRSAR